MIPRDLDALAEQFEAARRLHMESHSGDAAWHAGRGSAFADCRTAVLALAAGGARAPQWQPDLKLWARRLLAQVNDIREYGQSEGLDPAEVLALTLSELLAAASGVGPSPPHEGTPDAQR